MSDVVDAFWEEKLTGADLSEYQRRIIHEKMAQFKEVVAWFKEEQSNCSNLWVMP